jgi:hypothetical protein
MFPMNEEVFTSPMAMFIAKQMVGSKLDSVKGI